MIKAGPKDRIYRLRLILASRKTGTEDLHIKQESHIVVMPNGS